MSRASYRQPLALITTRRDKPTLHASAKHVGNPRSGFRLVRDRASIPHQSWMPFCGNTFVHSFFQTVLRYRNIRSRQSRLENKRHDPIEEIVSGSRSVASVTYLHCKENQWLAILFECTHNADFFLFSFSAAPFSPRFLAPRTIRWMIPTFSSC